MLEFKNVTKQYRSGMFGTHLTKAVDDVSFCVGENERLGLLGESGCGKSTIAQLAMKLLKPSKGSIEYNGKNIKHMSRSEMKNYRKNVQIIFQNPQQVFNPRMKFRETISEPVRIYNLASSPEEEKRIISEHMEMFGLPEELFDRYPQEISGGQAQRIAIMRILMLKPEIIIADEPTTMLDVSVQAQILELLENLHKKHGISIIFISHDLRVVYKISDHVMIMKDGRVVEYGETKQLYRSPQADYTKQLLKAAGIA